jgi:hypothetical protein
VCTRESIVTAVSRACGFAIFRTGESGEVIELGGKVEEAVLGDHGPESSERGGVERGKEENG